MTNKTTELPTANRSIIDEVRSEMLSEVREEAKKKIKVKLRELAAATVVVHNIERELEDLEREIKEAFKYISWL